MKIGFDAKRAFNNSTGLGNYARLLIESLLIKYPEHNYFLFTPTIDEKYSNLFNEYANVQIIQPEKYIYKKIHAAWRTFGVGSIINELKLNIFHGLSNEIPTGIDRSKTKILVTIHDLIFLRYPNYYNNIDAYIYKKKFKRACNESDLILATSKQTKRDIEEFFYTEPYKTKVIYQDCNNDFALKFTSEQKNEIKRKYHLPSKFILSVGTIETRKNQLTILKALAKLNADWSLVLIGKKTAYFNEIYAFANKNNLLKRVIVLENISSIDLPIIYQCADVFVYISEFEGFGIPVLEAMKSEIPVITSNSSSLPEVIGDTGLKINHLDSDAIVSFINNQFEQKDIIEENIKAAKLRTQLFDRNEIAFLINDLYIKLSAIKL